MLFLEKEHELYEKSLQDKEEIMSTVEIKQELHNIINNSEPKFVNFFMN